MLGFFGNLGPTEFILLVVVSILVFGKRLPHVAGQAYVQLGKLRSSMDKLRRETGIDREIRTIERTMRETAREANLQDPFVEKPAAPVSDPAPAPVDAPPPAESEPQAKPGAADDAGAEHADRREEPSPPA